MPTLTERINTATEKLEADATIQHNIIHGGPSVVVTTEGGNVKSLAKAIADLESAYTTAGTGYIAQCEAARDAAETHKNSAEAARDAAGESENAAATYATQAESAAGSTYQTEADYTSSTNKNLDTSTVAQIRNVVLGAAAGAGAYTGKFILPTLSEVEGGDILNIKVNIVASDNPTIEIRSNTAGGTLLASFSGSATVARVGTVRLVHNGSAYEVVGPILCLDAGTAAVNASNSAAAAPGAAASGTSKNYARADHVHPTDTTRAPLASPAFTGTPTAPTAAVTVNSTQLATTAWMRDFLASSQRITLPTSTSFWTFTKSLSGAESIAPFGMRISCGTSEGYCRWFAGMQNAPISRGLGLEIINFSKATSFSTKFLTTSTNADATFRLTLGKITGDGHGALTRKGFGILVQNTTLKVIAHNGTSETVGSTGFTITAGQTIAVRIMSDGAGNVSLYVNETLIETISGGPTGNSSSQAGLMWETDNNASANGCSGTIGHVDLNHTA